MAVDPEMSVKTGNRRANDVQHDGLALKRGVACRRADHACMESLAAVGVFGRLRDRYRDGELVARVVLRSDGAEHTHIVGGAPHSFAVLGVLPLAVVINLVA